MFSLQLYDSYFKRGVESQVPWEEVASTFLKSHMVVPKILRLCTFNEPS